MACDIIPPKLVKIAADQVAEPPKLSLILQLLGVSF